MNNYLKINRWHKLSGSESLGLHKNHVQAQDSKSCLLGTVNKLTK